MINAVFFKFFCFLIIIRQPLLYKLMINKWIPLLIPVRVKIIFFESGGNQLPEIRYFTRWYFGFGPIRPPFNVNTVLCIELYPSSCQGQIVLPADTRVVITNIQSQAFSVAE